MLSVKRIEMRCVSKINTTSEHDEENQTTSNGELMFELQIFSFFVYFCVRIILVWIKFTFQNSFKNVQLMTKYYYFIQTEQSKLCTSFTVNGAECNADLYGMYSIETKSKCFTFCYFSSESSLLSTHFSFSHGAIPHS